MMEAGIWQRVRGIIVQMNRIAAVSTIARTQGRTDIRSKEASTLTAETGKETKGPSGSDPLNDAEEGAAEDEVHAPVGSRRERGSDASL